MRKHKYRIDFNSPAFAVIISILVLGVCIALAFGLVFLAKLLAIPYGIFFASLVGIILVVLFICSIRKED